MPYQRKNYRALVAGDEEGSVQRLLALVPSVPPTSWNDLELGPYRPANAAATRIELTALAALQPQRLVPADPLELELAVDINELFDHAKASKLPQWAPRITGSPASGTVAERLLHPAGEHTVWTRTLKESSDDALESHGFDEVARRALRADDWQSALEARAARVRNIVSEFVAQRARWRENDRPSLEYLAVDSAQP